MVTININGDKTNTASKNVPNPHRLNAEPHDALPDAEQKANSRELLSDIERAGPHIYDRVRQADRASVTDAKYLINT